ncbi:FAD/NAD(P)-binding domain-containing protein [Cadophora sp. DSE1049]|nr:FAD/NAD(P)-binding domain-containing protein [Cadophora sp. DSE1049]
MRDRPIPRKTRNPTTVAVIGAGVSGLTAAKYLLAERIETDPDNSFFEVTVFERKKQAGGIWNQTLADDLYATPMYPSCNTNVPRSMMQYDGVPYPPHTPLFPRNSVVKDYLHEYAKSLESKNMVRYNSEVTLVKHGQKDYHRKWKIDVKVTTTGSVKTFWFDCVVVALGTFTQPSVPAMFEVQRTGGGTIMHSKQYRSAKEFSNKRVLIVGNGPSYWDMAKDISEVCEGEVLVSTRKNERIPLSSGKQRQVSEVLRIASFPNHSLVIFKSGAFYQSSTEVDVILLCTGYQYDFSMIPCIKTPEDKRRVLSLYDHMICLKEDSDPTREISIKDYQDLEPKGPGSESTLAFVGLLTMDNVFLVAEAQSALIARYFSGRWVISQPAMKKHRQLEYDRLKAAGLHASHNFHSMRYPSDADYVDRLFEECLDTESPASMGTGKTPPFHSLYLHWVRGRIGEIRTKFNTIAWDYEDERYSSLELLGFDLASFDCDSDLKKKVELMSEFCDLMNEKNRLWQKNHKDWKAASGEWEKRWKRQMEEWKLEMQKLDNLRVDTSVDKLGEELARRL